MTEPTPVQFHRETVLPIHSLREGQIILSTLNAKFIHASLGLRYLHANMGRLKQFTTLCEYTINQRVFDIAEELVIRNPDIIGFGVYIWNVKQTTELISAIKAIAPDTIIVVGGPEVSYEFEQTQIFSKCDYLITGQADFAFNELCESLLTEHSKLQLPAKVINAVQPSVNQLKSPYHLYSDQDLKNRILYVEASRGCPFKCEFCLSALDKTAWPFDLSLFLADMESLYDRGARQFKFVDRTFNLKVKSCIEILNFFLERLDENLFLHFEVIPDKLPDELKTVLKQFPHSTLQFEIGIQSFNPSVQDTISRRQDDSKTMSNLGWLRRNTQAYLHADLIFGLPGETLQSFASGFDQLVELAPHEIQVGILKRLRGTNISRHTDHFGMIYSPDAPYQLLCNHEIDFPTMQKLQRFARYWDLIANSSRFTNSLPVILQDKPFQQFWQLSEWIYKHSGQTHKISLQRLFELVYNGSVELNLHGNANLIESLHADYQTTGERRAPRWMTRLDNTISQSEKTVRHNSRQARYGKH